MTSLEHDFTSVLVDSVGTIVNRVGSMFTSGAEILNGGFVKEAFSGILTDGGINGTRNSNVSKSSIIQSILYLCLLYYTPLVKFTLVITLLVHISNALNHVKKNKNIRFLQLEEISSLKKTCQLILLRIRVALYF